MLHIQAASTGKNYNVIKNVSTHSMLHDPDGELDMKLELEDIGICLARDLEDRNIHQAEKQTQTDLFPMSSSMNLGVANGTSACNHPSLSCQELLALSTGLTTSPSSQLAFDSKKLKYCSTYNLAEGIDIDAQQKAIYHLGADLDVITPTKKKPMFRCLAACWGAFAACFTHCRACLSFTVDHNIFQQGILLCIFINTFSMGIEYHDQPETLTRVVEISNLVFSTIFTVEMLLKLAAFGFVEYVSDGFNVFDGLIVCLRYLNYKRVSFRD